MGLYQKMFNAVCVKCAFGTAFFLIKTRCKNYCASLLNRV